MNHYLNEKARREMDELGDIMMMEIKVRQLQQVFNIIHITRDQVIHTNDMVAFANKSIAKM